MFSKDIIKGNMNLIVLSSLIDGEKYGYEITKVVQNLTEGAIQLKEGSLYPTLHKLEKDKLIEGYWVQQDPGKPSRKYYRITDEGIKTVEQEKQRWKFYINVMGRVIYGDPNT
ncbi:PadR family transcriptional regulator [Pseudobacteroides cellulosolvens]|uniref:Transcriptional regulator, PadR-like family n=1 Tax=Pseudobacteroides cellulosolvens ATCC 35603 = DSM 2933 TaxID=398512 RepID=A0A0L6JS39_9FIRM|nr:PadR family transcriptional regulator [Pseudobacteroides cellulosolvens]KNY28666.1 transcriptional regulator, PadR-like family [Pseudobacteroides cellulosolvens ATCC 35603 = DSM 2933]